MSSVLQRIFAGSQIATTLAGTKPNPIESLQTVIENLGDRLEQIPFTFLSSYNQLQSTNVANNVLIQAGQPVPVGYYGVVEDFNVIFGTVAGTVKISVMDYNFANKITDYQTGLSATNNGAGYLRVEQTQTLCLLGQTAGTGTVNVFCSGFIKRYQRISTPKVT